jgi:hypothetical protein
LGGQIPLALQPRALEARVRVGVWARLGFKARGGGRACGGRGRGVGSMRRRRLIGSKENGYQVLFGGLFLSFFPAGRLFFFVLATHSV